MKDLAFGAMGGKESKAHLKAPIPNVYFGPGYTDAEIEQVLDHRGLQYTQGDSVERKIAELLREGFVVARVNGKMEYGPWSLGNRSILYHPADKSVNDWLNVNLHRKEFMPFAPALKMDLGSRCFHGIQGAEQAAKFMTVTFECTEEMTQQGVGVVHVDGSEIGILKGLFAGTGTYQRRRRGFNPQTLASDRRAFIL